MKNRILLICPTFFEYYKLFISELNKHEFEVDYISLSLELNFLEKVLNKISKNMLKNKFDKYFEVMCNKIQNYDYKKIVVIFGGAYFDLNNFLYLKANFKSKFIFYSWDSVHNYPRILNYYRYFDLYFSFDKRDSEKYGFHFLPLFSIYKESLIKCNYDCSFVGTMAMSKIKAYLNILSSLPKDLVFYEYLYMPSKFSYYYNLFFHYKYFSKLNKKDIHFTPLSSEDYGIVLSNSKVIIDCTRENQNGLTMRTIDAVCSRKRIITNNTSISNYEFYDAKNILIVADSSRKIGKGFFSCNNRVIYRNTKSFIFSEWVKIVFEL